MKRIINDTLEYFSNINNLLPAALGLAIFVILLIFKTPISKGILNICGKAFFRKTQEKRTALKNSLKKPLAYLIATIGLIIGVSINYTSKGLTKFFKIVIILEICWAIINYLSGNLFLLFHFGKDADEKLNTTVIKFISNILKIVIIAFAVVMVISELGYNINGLITGLGVGGLAISLAAQDAISNMISGFIIVFEKPFKVGDLIKSSTVEGFVEEVTMRTTKIRQLDDSLITVPNSTLTSNAVVNESEMQKRRIDFKFGLLYSTSNDAILKIKSQIEHYLIENNDILPSPVRVYFKEFDDSSINFEIVCYTTTGNIDEYLNIREQINLKIKEIVESNQTDFAFPTTTVHIDK